MNRAKKSRKCIISVILSAVLVLLCFSGCFSKENDIFNIVWEKTEGFGGGGYGSIGGSDGQYAVTGFEVSDGFEMPEVTKFKIYKAEPKMLDEKTCNNIKDTVIELFKAYEKEQNGYTAFFDSENNELSFTRLEEEPTMFHFNRSLDAVYVENLKKTLKSYSLSKLKKDGIKESKKYADAFGKALGTAFEYDSASEKEIYISTQFSEKDGMCDCALVKTYCFKFKSDKSSVKIENEQFEAPLIRNSDENVKHFEDASRQFLEIILYPDLTVYSITDNTVNCTLTPVEEQKMFTQNQLKSYEKFADMGPDIRSDSENDTAVFDKVKGFYYHYSDAFNNEDGNMGAYAVLEYHLKSDKSKKYELGVSVAAVRENISTYDSLSSVITDKSSTETENETQWNYTPCYFADDFAFTDFDAPAIYTLKDNPEADKLESAAQKLVSEKLTESAFEKDGGYRSLVGGFGKHCFNYNVYTGVFEYNLYPDGEYVEEYRKKYDGKTFDVNAMRSTAVKAAECFEDTVGKLEYKDCTSVEIQRASETQTYGIAAYSFIFTSDKTENSRIDDERSIFDGTRAGVLSVTVLADMTVCEIKSGIICGYEKTAVFDTAIYGDDTVTLVMTDRPDDTLFINKVLNYSYKTRLDSKKAELVLNVGAYYKSDTNETVYFDLSVY